MIHYQSLRNGFKTAALATVALLTAAACSENDLAKQDADMGGDHPGVVLQISPKTISLAGMSASTRIPTDNNYAYPTPAAGSTITVQLIKEDGSVLVLADKPIQATFKYGDPTWTPIDDTDAAVKNNLYVTGGSGAYRMRAFGKIVTEDGDCLAAAYAGSAYVNDDGYGTGSFRLTQNEFNDASLEAKSAGVNVIVKDADGNTIGESISGPRTVEFTGLKSFDKFELADGNLAINTTDVAFRSTGDAIASTPLTLDLGSATGISRCNIVPGSYPEAGSTGDKQPLFTVTYDGSTYTATATAGAYKLEPGKVYKFTLTLDGTDLSVNSVTVDDFTTGTGIDLSSGNIAFKGTIAEFVAKYEKSALSPADPNFKALPANLFNNKKIIFTDADATDWGELNLDNDNSNASKLEWLFRSYTNTGKGYAIEMPNFVGKIPDGTFSGYTGLHTLSMPKALKMGARILQSDHNLKTVNLPSVTNLGYEALSANEHLGTLILGAVSEITYLAFASYENCDLIFTSTPTAGNLDLEKKSWDDFYPWKSITVLNP